MNKQSTINTVAICATILASATIIGWAGPLNPPAGPIMDTGVLGSRTPIGALPFTINQSGSYFLTGVLTGNVGQNGITIDADDVTLDLNGFALIGVAGSGDGVVVLGAQQNIEIANGSVRGWGGDGVDAGSVTNGAFENLRISSCVGVGLVVGARDRVARCTASNCVIGILTGNFCVISECSVFGSIGQGMLAGLSCTITDCVAEGNGFSGIDVNQGSVVSNCASRDNGHDGVRTGVGSTVLGCAAWSNDEDGFAINGRSRISDCTSSFNGFDGINLGSNSTARHCTSSANADDGIFAASECTVVENDLSDNGVGAGGAGVTTSGFGIRVESNNVNSNGVGLQSTTAENYFADNTVQANMDNYDFVGGNQLNLLLGEIPETIEWPASVRLAGTLFGTAMENGINVNSGDVTIDMGGHALLGVPMSLQGINSGPEMAVYNGVVRNWGGNGIDNFADAILVQGVRAVDNSGSGITTGTGSVVANCLVNGNMDDGVSGFSSSVVAQSAVRDNTMEEVAGNRFLITQCYTDTVNMIEGLIHASSYLESLNVTTDVVDSQDR